MGSAGAWRGVAPFLGSKAIPASEWWFRPTCLQESGPGFVWKSGSFGDAATGTLKTAPETKTKRLETTKRPKKWENKAPITQAKGGGRQDMGPPGSRPGH